MQHADDPLVVTAKQDGARLEPELEVIVPVHHGVLGVVGDGPQQVGEKQQPGHGRQGIGLGRIGHGNGPGERHPEHQLRDGNEALHEGVADRQQQAGERQAYGERVQGQHQGERDERQHGEQDQHLPFVDPAHGQRSPGGAFHVAVEVAIRIVIDDAARRAHQEDPHHEHGQDPGIRQAARRETERPQGRPQQQEGADGLVDAGQLHIGQSPLLG
ncbi:hypothetical protein D3C72_827510 [compost metagenome]